MDTDVVVVGAGHNGMVAAFYLARAGLRVAVFERLPRVGGACVTEELWPGYHFSPCAHMTHGLHPKILRDLDLWRRGLVILPRADDLRLLDDGTYWGPSTHASPRNRGAEGRMTPDERDGVARFGAFARTLREIFAPYRLQPPPSEEAVRRAVEGTPAAAVLDHALRTTVSELVAEFMPAGLMRERYAAGWGSIGRNPGALSLAYASLDLPDEQGERPPHGYVQGGMGVVSRLIQEALAERGVAVQTEQAVEQLLVERERVLGVRLADGREVRSRVVLSNLDPKRTFLRLAPSDTLPAAFRARVAALTTSPSCYKLLAALSEAPAWRDWDGDPNQPGQGAVQLDWTWGPTQAAYDDVDAGVPPRAPHISFSLPSAVDPSLAPAGGHTASAWIFPAPPTLRAGSWEDVREAVAERLIDQITARAPNFRRSILAYRLRTPLDLEREQGLTDGCIWHVQHGAEHLFWNRPLPELADYRTPLAALYLCGAGQHPGGEVSGVPGHNAAHEVLKDMRLS